MTSHLVPIEEARLWANLFESKTKFGKMALTVIALSDEVEALQAERDRLQDALDWLHDEMYPDDPLAQGVLRAVLAQRPWEAT